MCLECSGSHRHMGVHISQCRSLKLDTECWQGEVLEFMCSVGNAVFNRAWEQECPVWVVHPEEYPYLPHVRMNYIEQKYMYRQFLRKEVGPEEAGGDNDGDETTRTFSDAVWSVCQQGPVSKRSPSNRMSPWQARFIKLCLRNGEPVLSYYKDKNYGEAKGEIDLRGSFSGLVEKSDCEKNHPHSFHIRTRDESEHRGRDFLFSVGTPKEAINWVQSIRRQSGQESMKSERISTATSAAATPSAATPAAATPPAGTPPAVGGMEMARLDSKRNAATLVVEDEAVFKGKILQREAYAYGRWYQRFAVVSKNDFFVFVEEGGACICALPLKGGKVDKYPLNCDRELRTPEGSFGVLCALSHVAFDAGSEREKVKWISAVESSITKFR